MHNSAKSALQAARNDRKGEEHHYRSGGRGANGVSYVADGRGGATRYEYGPDGQTFSEKYLPPK